MKTMHNLSILFLLILLSILGCQSSKTSTTSTPADSKSVAKVTTKDKANPLYKPFTEFKGDTLQYLNYNFVEHKDQYIGKTFSVLYHDLEITVKSSVAGPDANNGFVSSNIDLYFVDDNTVTYHMNFDAVPLYIIIVTWEKPISAEAFFQLYKASNGNWTPDYEAFLANNIIKDVSVMKYVNRKIKAEE